MCIHSYSNKLPIMFIVINTVPSTNVNQFTDTGVTVNAVYPGISTTDISRHLPFYNSFTRFFIKPVAWLFLKSAAKGSQTLVHAAIDPELENVSGKFIR